MMFSRGVAATSISQGDYRYPFLKVAPILRRATLAMANLEGPLSDRGKQLNMFRGDPAFWKGSSMRGSIWYRWPIIILWTMAPLLFLIRWNA